MSDNKIDKIMADLINEANTVSAARVVFRTLNDNIDLINQHEHSTFFVVVMETCRQCMILSTAKIFDRSKYDETSSLKYLKKALCEGRGVEVDKDEVCEIIETIDDFLQDHDIAGTLNRIKEIRHQFVAHKQTIADQKAKDITLHEFYGFIDETFELLDQVADKIGFHVNKKVTKGSTVRLSLQSVLDTLYSPSGNPSHNAS